LSDPSGRALRKKRKGKEKGDHLIAAWREWSISRQKERRGRKDRKGKGGGGKKKGANLIRDLFLGCSVPVVARQEGGGGREEGRDLGKRGEGRDWA